MSLLNNALRQAEERQRRPDVSAAYTGSVQEGRGGLRWPVVLLCLLVLGLTGAGFYGFAMMNSATQDVSEEPMENPVQALAENDTGQGQVDRAEAVIEQVEEPQPSGEAPFAEVTDSEVTEPVEVREPVEVAEPEIPEEPAKPEAVPERAISAAEESEPEVPEPAPARERVSAADSEPEQTEPVKTAPKSPEAIDRQTAKELETLIAGDRVAEAENRLTQLTQTQAAPRSRFVVARALVVDGKAARALDWLPETLTGDDPKLRMLRARAQHADGRLDAAVATLESRVPAVADQPEYRVTLATLLQQQGQNEEAASHWAELIAWDDSRAPWWVGLAIALEEQGETRGAARAYEQAVALPGLPPSLTDYVQRRLQSLRAG